MPDRQCLKLFPPLEAPFEYFSHVLAALDERWLPNPLPACASCPASSWYTTAEMLACYCSSFGRSVWSRTADPLVRCDGREKALARFRSESD